MEKDTFTHPITNPSKEKGIEPNIHRDIDPTQPMGKEDKNYNDPSQVFPSETGS